MRGHPVALLVVELSQDCRLMTWNTQRKLQRKGRTWGPKFFNYGERRAVCGADAKSWTYVRNTGAIEVVLPPAAVTLPLELI